MLLNCTWWSSTLQRHRRNCNSLHMTVMLACYSRFITGTQHKSHTTTIRTTAVEKTLAPPQFFFYQNTYHDRKIITFYHKMSHFAHRMLAPWMAKTDCKCKALTIGTSVSGTVAFVSYNFSQTCRQTLHQPTTNVQINFFDPNFLDGCFQVFSVFRAFCSNFLHN